MPNGKLRLKWLQDGKGSRVFNFETGAGFSVRDVINQVKIVTNRMVPMVEGVRHPGYYTKLLSGFQLACAKLGWEPK